MLADSSVWANWAVAVGTILLASATFRLARRAGDEAKAVKDEAQRVGEQVELQREQLELANRAFVYPWLPHDWVMGTGYWNTADLRLALLPLKNAGPGVARNVRGRVIWNLGPGQWRHAYIAASTIAPGDNENGRISPPTNDGWSGALGYVRWVDLAGEEWVTYFRMDKKGDLLVGEHQPPERIEEVNPDNLDEANLAARTRAGTR